jgi:hypothetical protein
MPVAEVLALAIFGIAGRWPDRRSGSARGFCIGSPLEPTLENLETVRHIQSPSAVS